MDKTENEVAAIVVDAAYTIHRKLGPGLFESVYSAVLQYELRKRGLGVQRELPITLSYDGIHFDVGFRVDFLVHDLVIVELKSVEQLARVHKKQVLTYLRLTKKRLGLLVNFGAPTMKEGLVRLVNGLPD